VLDQKGQRGQKLLDSFFRRRRILAATQIDNDPGHISEERHRNVGADELQKRSDHAQFDDKVATVGSVADDVAERPDRLLADVLVGRVQEAQEVLDGAGEHDRLCKN